MRVRGVPAPRCATVDFETRSTVSLRKSGVWRYSLDPTTEVLCLAYRLPTWEPKRTSLWHPAFPQLGIDPSNEPELKELLQWILSGGLVEAHNAFFERCIWRHILEPQYGFPAIPVHQWRDSAVKAAAHALPRALEEVTNALRLVTKKDMVGSKLMQKLSKPRKIRKAELEAWKQKHGCKKPPVLYYESKEWFERLWTYCRQDVLAEAAVSECLPDCNVFETELFGFDQVINDRGFTLDRHAITAALHLLGEETTRLNVELTELTDGVVERATQRARLLVWLEAQGLKLYDTQKTTLEDILQQDDARDEETPPWVQALTPAARKAVEILRTLGRSSTAKYQAMQNWIGPDNRVHGGLLFHGASTGRWTGMGVQPHNFPKGTIPHFDPDFAWEALKTCSTEEINAEWGSVTEPLSCALRSVITASPGRTLFVADYSSIEARVLLWLAQDDDALGIFRRHEDPYCVMASDIYDRVITKADKQERQLGKAAVLGCGYQMGASKFVTTAASYGVEIDEDFAQTVVDAYRERFWRVKTMWRDQENAAIQAVQHPKRRVKCGRVVWVVDGRFLYCELPSGRRLAYCDPKIQSVATSWGSTRDTLTYMGVNSYSHQWTRQSTYGGMLVENITQAVARDIMAEAMWRCEQTHVYHVVLTVHDEIITEAHPALGSVQEFVQLLTTIPDWAKGLPIEADGWSGFRYHK